MPKNERKKSIETWLIFSAKIIGWVLKVMKNYSYCTSDEAPTYNYCQLKIAIKHKISPGVM